MAKTIGSFDLASLKNLRDDVTQYFWFESNSSSAWGSGAHVTLYPESQFTDSTNPNYMKGQNIIMNTDGFSIRNGGLPMMTLDNNSLDFNVVDIRLGRYTRVATFGTDGVTIGLIGETRADIDFHSMKLIDTNGESYFIANDLRDASGLSIIKQTFTATYAMYDNSGIIYPIYTPVTQIVDVVDENGESWLGEVSIDLENAGTANEYFDISTQSDDSGTQLTIIYKSTSVAYNYLLGTYKAGGTAGPYSAVIGKNNEASGVASIAEGSNTSAKGFGCHAEGVGTLATYSMDYAEQVGAHAEGVNSKAFGLGAHAEGYDTRSTYKGHAQNEGTNANAIAQTAIGTYNIIDASPTTTHPNGINSYGKYAVIVGNGTSSARSNALTIDWQGNVDASGSVITTAKYNDAYNAGSSAGYSVTVSSLAGSTYLGQAIRLEKVSATNKHPIFNGFDISGTGTARIHTLGHYIYKATYNGEQYWYAYIKMRNDNTSAISSFTVTAYIAWV